MWLTSRHAIETALSKKVSGTLYLTPESRNAHLERLAHARGISTEFRTAKQIRELAHADFARGAALHILDKRAATSTTSVADFLWSGPAENSLVLLLDHINDPHNLGAILRSANMFAADLVVIPDRRASGITDAVFRASAGAASFVTVAKEKNIAQTLEKLKDGGYWIYAAEMGGVSSYGVDFAGRTVLILGGEGRGVSDLVAKRSDALVGIPTRGNIDSLNVSVSAAILMYEYRRAFPAKKD